MLRAHPCALTDPERGVAQLSFSAAHWEELLRVLACSDAALRSVVQRWPGISRLPVPEVMQRLLSLKVRGAWPAAHPLMDSPASLC